MSTISVSPITTATFNLSHWRKTQKTSKIFAVRLGFCGGFNLRKSVSWVSERKTQIIMKGFNEVRTSTRDENFEVFEQEAFVDGSLKCGARGLEATLNSLSKWLVAVLFAAVVIWRHDAEALWAAMGAVLNALLSVTLKQILKQERPFSTLRSNPGMPSSHAQAIFYTITFLNLSMVEWFGLNALTTTLCGFFFILGSYFNLGLGLPNNFTQLCRSLSGLLLDRFSPYFGSGPGKCLY
ncbi:hypothetical protein CASFOL_034332 [Castilleja foliolosa]|uniref:Phosphatidic acid phosphatase type 2/haloperoxidase domain-containing protein n=1 Tax=Castilleja foliolosa TaxID=1961234 RepID=A0ABD3BWF9_9LAMI